MNSTNNISARAAFDHAKKMFYKAFIGDFVKKYGPGERAHQECMAYVDSLKLSQNEVRTEVTLTTTANQFTFGVTTQQYSTGATSVNATEQRLNLQDSLCVNEYGFFIAKPASATAVNFSLDTYANPNTYSTTNAAAALNGTLYSNGQFKLTCNNDILVPGRGLYNHKYVPQTQGGVGITAQTIFPLDQQRGAEDGFVTAEPNFVLVGSKNNVPQIVLPGALAAVETNMRAVLIFRGILAQNSTVVS